MTAVHHRTQRGMFRSLDSIVGNDDAARAWFTSDNHALGARPVDLILHTEGLVRVIFYLDHMTQRDGERFEVA